LVRAIIQAEHAAIKAPPRSGKRLFIKGNSPGRVILFKLLSSSVIIVDKSRDRELEGEN